MDAQTVERQLRALPAETRARMEREAEEEIETFDTFFQAIGNQALSRLERAILKTFLVAKATGLLPSAPAPL